MVILRIYCISVHCLGVLTTADSPIVSSPNYRLESGTMTLTSTTFTALVSQLSLRMGSAFGNNTRAVLAILERSARNGGCNNWVLDEIAEYRLAYLPDEIARAADEGGSASCGESVEDASYPGVAEEALRTGHIVFRGESVTAKEVEESRESWRSYHEHDPCYFPTKMARVFNIYVLF